MAADFPVSIPSIPRVTAQTKRNAPGYEGDVLHNKLADEVEALATVVGVTGSVVPGTVEARIATLQSDTAAAVSGLSTHDHNGGDGGQIAYSNLSGLPTLGTAAALDVGTTAGTVAAGDDARLAAESASSIGVLIAGAADKVAPNDADRLALSDSAAASILKKLTWINIKQRLAEFLCAGGLINGGTVINPKIIANSVDSIPDAGADHTILITAAVNQGSRIGVVGKPGGVAGSNSDPAAASDAERGLPWTSDAAYPNNGIAHVSCIVGGYDHVCNQEAGTLLGGGHNFLQYNANGHGTIVGGSNHRNAGARGAIVGGLNNTIKDASSYGGVFAGSGASVSASWSVTLGGENPIIKSGASGAAIVSGRGNSIGTSAYFSAALCSQNGVVQDTHGYALIAGRAPKSECSGAFTIGVKPLVNNGDCQISTVGYGVRTTNATITTMALADGAWMLGTVACAVVVDAQVVGVDEATGNVCAYTCSAVVKWDGSSISAVADSGGSSASSRPFAVVNDGIGVAGVPLLAADSGNLRVRVTGKASTTIKWCARIDACAVRV